MTKYISILAVLMASTWAQAQPMPVGDAEVKIDAKVDGQVAVLTAKTDGKVVSWIAITDGLTFPVPPDLLKDPRTAVVQGAAGTYRVIAVTSVADKPAWGDVVFTIKGRAPDPVIPPGPGPQPPPEPKPGDTLPLRLQAAYDGDASPAKKGQLVQLIGLYSAATDYAGSKDVANLGVLLDKIQSVGKDMLLPNVLVECRKIISSEVREALGPPDTSVNLGGADDPTRLRAVATFQRIAFALSKVK